MQDLEQTIYQCQQGNALAWEALIKHYQAKVYGVAWYFFHNRHEAEDVTQEVFIKVYRRLDTFQSGIQSFVPWLLAIARNSCIDRLRKTSHRITHEDQASQAHEERARDADPGLMVSAEQRKQLIYQALDEFSQANREIILFKDIQGMKNEEVAEILSLPLEPSNRDRAVLE